MSETAGRERDLVLAPNQQVFILDETKGHVVDYVGPYKTSLGNTDRPVIYNSVARRYERAELIQATKEFPFADEGWYIILENPAKNNEVPSAGANNTPALDLGRKVNIPGPASFPLWPGQAARVIQGHHLRSNQYLVVRVYNDEAADTNWQKSVMKPQAGREVTVAMPELTMGKLLVIRGTDVSFYIPPTGIEVVPDGEKFVRDAVTLERLEYCILLNENGDKRFVPGPDVVFPEPTETFITKGGSRKFRAIELNEDMGIYVKVIADYAESDGEERKVGEELFITGKEQKIYFPRSEHAIVRYGNKDGDEDIHDVHYAVVIPEGEARYVLDKSSGKISPVRGSRMFLPDPRKEVIVRRVLDLRTVELWFPGNQEALEYNRRLASLTASGKPSEYVTDREARAAYGKGPELMARSATLAADAESHGLAAEDFRRRTTFTPPRTITLDTKYDGAVSIGVWTGYAIQVVSKTGGREVVVGPTTRLLEYDEMMEVLQLSTEKPKSTDRLEKTVYLRVKHNQVSDIVSIVTQDMVQADIKLSYRVNFEGEPDKWFNVENYVKFLTDHMRSMIRNATKQCGIEKFNNDAINIIRDTVLGTQGADGKRLGRTFPENGMRIYDVEVLDVKIGDERIATLLVGAQHEAVQRAIEVARNERNLEITKRTEVVQQRILRAKAKTKKTEIELAKEQLEKELDLALERIASEVGQASARLEASLESQEDLTKIKTAELTRKRSEDEQEIQLEQQRLDQRLAEIKAEIQAVVEKAKAVSPDLIVALQAFSDRSLAEKAAESMAPLAILGGKSVAQIMAQLLSGTVLGDTVQKSMSKYVGSASPGAR